MDLKARSKGWVGSMYNKLEAMCQGVDDFVNKETVKYVENQAQTVGESMKALYSGMVEDFLNPVADPLKRKIQVVSEKQNYAVETYTSSVTGITENPIKEQLSLEQEADTALKNHIASTLSKLVDVDFNSSVGNDSVTTTCENSGKDFEENSPRAEELVDEESSSSGYIISPECRKTCSDKDSKDTILFEMSPSTSVHDSRPLDTQCRSFSDEFKCVYDVSSSQIFLKSDIIEEELPLGMESNLFQDNLSESQIRDYMKNEKVLDSSCSVNCISTVPSTQMVLQWNTMWEDQPVTDQSDSFGDMALSKSLAFSMEEGHGDSTTAKFSHPTSLFDTELGTFPEDERGGNRCSDAAESVYNVSTTQIILQDNIISEEQLPTKESSSARDKSLLQITTFASDVHPNSLYDARVGANMTVMDNFIDDFSCVSGRSSIARVFEDTPNTFQSSEHDLSQVLLETENVDADNTLSNSSVLAESSNLSTSSIGSCMQEEESVSSIFTSISSSMSTPLASRNDVIDVIPPLSSAAWLTYFSDINASSSHEAVKDAGSIKSYRDWGPIPKFKALMSPSEIGDVDDFCVDLTDPGMETIDLSDKGKLEESCVLVDSKLHHDVSFRPRKFKSYKEIITEAFASRKRLIKEYKHLSVLYADVDAETNQHSGLFHLPSLPPPCLHSTESPTCNNCESGWELL